MNELRHKWEFHPNPICATLHISERVTDRFKYFTNPCDDLEEQPEFVKQLFQIPGIVGVSLHQYGIHIDRAEIYSWDEITGEAEKIISGHFGILEQARNILEGQ